MRGQFFKMTGAVLLGVLGGALVLLFLYTMLPDGRDRIADRPGSRVTVDCGSKAKWDSDGDGVSNSIEENNRREKYFAFDRNRCDKDPSRPIKTHDNGSLRDGLNLTDKGEGYIHRRGPDPMDADDWGTLTLITCLEAVGRKAETAGLRVDITDLSRRQGGPFPPHVTHQNGLDVDLRYVSIEGYEGPFDIAVQPELYDPVATQQVLAAFVQECNVSVIFVDLETLGFTGEEIGTAALTDWPGHSNHFHVSLERPN